MSNYRRQCSFPTLTSRYHHGGELCLGRRKEARPIATKKAMHIVMHSIEARGLRALTHPRNAAFIRCKLRELSARNRVKVYEVSVNSNHLHCLLKAETRTGFQTFLRTLAGQIAQFITQAKRGRPFGRRFWSLLAFSRIVAGGRAFQIARNYVIRNQLELLRIISYTPRNGRYRKNGELVAMIPD